MTKQFKREAGILTASETYSDRMNNVDAILAKIQKRLKAHRAEEKRTPSNWGNAGDAGHIQAELAQVLAFLGDRSAVDALGLEY